MISERGRIVAIESHALWVETIQQSTCGRCVAKGGCGQSLLSKIGINNSFLRVLLDGQAADQFSIGEEVCIGIPDDIVVKSSLLAYLLPIVLLVLFAGVTQQYISQESIVIAMGMLGLVFGGVLIRCFSYFLRNNNRYQPVLLSNNSSNNNELNNVAQVVSINDVSQN